MAQHDAGNPIDDIRGKSLATDTKISAYNFNLNNLSPNFEDVIGRKRTIEFRGHKATLNTEGWKMWVKFCSL